MWSKKTESGLVIDSKTFLPIEEPEVRQYASSNEVYYLGLPLVIKAGLKDAYTANFKHKHSKMDYTILLNDHIGYRYQIIKFLGQGSFGTVVKGYDHKLKTVVAIKICRRGEMRFAVMQHEAEILTDLKCRFEDGNFVKLHEYFIFRNTPFLVCELLDDDLHTFLVDSPIKGVLEMKTIREIIESTLIGLSQLQQMELIHGDLKPSNLIIWKHKIKKVKIIDFGGCRYANDRNRIQQFTRFYKAPEIILGLDYGLPIDMWALGCISVELYTGDRLFKGTDENDQLAAIMEVLGIPPATMTGKSRFRNKFFRGNSKPIYCTAPNGSVLSQILGTRKLPGALPLRNIFKHCGSVEFIDFVEKCLTWDPNVRLTPSNGLNHKWFHCSIQN